MPDAFFQSQSSPIGCIETVGKPTFGGGEMRTGCPASRGHLQIRFSLFDTIWALGSPIIALAARDAEIFSAEGALYCLISLAFALIAYSVFRVTTAYQSSSVLAMHGG